MAARGERVFVDVANKNPPACLPAIARRLAEGALPFPKEEKSLEQRLFDAEVRRDIEIEAIKYKAALASQPPRKANDENFASEISLRIQTKLAAATSRREEQLALKAAKGAFLATRRTTEPTSAAWAAESTHTQLELETKLNNASARKAERLYERVENAAALGTERVLGAAINRLKADAADDSARSDLKSALELALMETSRRKEATLLEIATRASRSGGSEKVAYVVERLAAEKRLRELALETKLDRATRLKKAQDMAAVEKAALTSTAKVAKVQRTRLAEENDRRLRLQDTLDARSDKAYHRREMETLDKVVRAASLGSAAVANASNKRDVKAAVERAEKENRLETKLAACALRRGAQVKLVVEKAAKRSELVAGAAKFRQDAAEHRLISLSTERVAAAERRRSLSLDAKVAEAAQLGSQRVKIVLERKKQRVADTTKSIKDILERFAAAQRRRSLLLDVKVTGAWQLGSQRVKTVLERKKQREIHTATAIKHAIELKQRAAAARHADNLEITRRGLNGKRHPGTYVPLRPIFKRNQENKPQPAVTTSSNIFGFISLGISAAFMALVGACVARFGTES